jgi:cyclic pyranopterin phosphate synthase
VENGFTHFDDDGNAVMVDIGDKPITDRIAVARGDIKVSSEVISAITSKSAKKGDVISVARIAGIMGAKKNSELIPLCHNINLTKVVVDFDIDVENSVIHAMCTAEARGMTGVEMEALTGVSVALLTVYDMCKAMDKHMEIGNIKVTSKSGGKSGDWSIGSETDDR